MDTKKKKNTIPFISTLFNIRCQNIKQENSARRKAFISQIWNYSTRKQIENMEI